MKFRVSDRAALEARLAALGARGGAAQHESNVLWDDAARSLKESGLVLRLRVVEGRGLLTMKGRATLAGGVKSRMELETGVESPEVLERILAALGYEPAFRYEKRRVSWRFAQPGRPEVVVDETPLGLFAEIEGDEPAIRALAEELGVPPSEFLSDSYVGLWRKARAADPWLPADMVFR